MRYLTFVLLLAAAAAIAPASVYAQSMLNYGLAVGAGSVAGTAGGRQISNSLDVIFGKTAKTAEKAGQQGAEGAQEELSEQQILQLKQQQQQEAERLRSDREAAAKKFAAPAPAASRYRPPSLPPPSMLGALWNINVQNIAPVAETLAAVTAESLTTIAAGASREQVLGNLGTPAARVVIPEGGQLHEVYYYSSGRDTVGTVRMSEGSVTGVIVNAN